MKMKLPEFIALSACSMTLVALGIDIMLPAFDAVRDAFGLESGSTVPAQIISFFFMGQIAQIIFGILADRFGRLAILRLGFPLYIVGGLAAAFSPNIPLMLAARFIAGVGASAVFMTTIAGVRDRFVGDEMARIMSLVFSIFLFTPILAPFLGIAVLSIASWQVVFLTPPLFAVIVFVWSLRLEESLPKDKRIALKWETILGSIRNVITNRVFLRYAAVTTLLFSALSSYVASSEHIVGKIYGRPELFVWIFAGMGSLMSFTSLMNSKLSAKFGARRTIRGALATYVVVGGFLLVMTLILNDPPPMSLFFGSVVIMLAINLAVEPNSSALALEPMGNMAGIAASVYGTIFFTVGASLGAIVSNMMSDGVYPLVISFFLIGVLAVLLVFADRRRLQSD
jgi:DHA1 family bicyclomycin/chloramphenicol resistance-like MFS transporter